MVISNGLYIPNMSIGLSESANYIWNTQSDCLGEGTYGKVYLGAHKKSGEKVAVKTFKHVDCYVSKEVQMLQTLQHQYIIQLHAIEIDLYTRHMVMIIELCNGGSLMNFLNEPENACGLLDSEFLLVLRHLSEGLEYLKKHNVIHRDVKPDNIMRHIFDDGRVVYKLADFGTARELPEGQNFNSLHGTQPYLHPKMFRVIYSPNPSETNREFDANTDLWSIGVTLYQTATGKLPFAVHPYMTLTVYDEIKYKEGVISASQDKSSDLVTYENKLPQSSRLSLGLKELLTPILAGLFVQDPEKQWSFAQYYDHVLALFLRKLINVFYVNEMQMLKVYLKPEESFRDFKRHIYEQTEVSEENQVFLYKQMLIVNLFDDFHSIDSGSECVFLFDRSSSNVEPVSKTQLIFENLSNFQSKFMSNAGGDEFRLAQIARRDLYVCKNLMDYQSTVYTYFGTFIKDFNDYCKEEQKELRQVHDILLERYSSVKDRVGILEKLQKMSESYDADFSANFEKTTNSFLDQTLDLFDDLIKIKTEVALTTCHDSYLKIVLKELVEMKSVTKQMYHVRTDAKLYEYEKIKIVRCVRTIMEILTDKMVPNFENFVTDVKRWYKDTFFAQVRALSVLKKLFFRYKCDLKRFEEEVHSRSEDNVKLITAAKEISLNKRKLYHMLQKYKQNTVDLQAILEDNLNVVEQMTELALSLKIDPTDL